MEERLLEWVPHLQEKMPAFADDGWHKLPFAPEVVILGVGRWVKPKSGGYHWPDRHAA